MFTVRSPVTKKIQFTLGLLDTVQQVAESSLPMPASSSNSGCSGSIRPGWVEEVQPFRDTAYFWHQIWQSCSRPINTQVQNIMKKTRNQYHYHYKKCKKAEQKLKKNKLLNACLGEGGDLFHEIKLLRQSAPVVATFIDGVTKKHPWPLWRNLQPTLQLCRWCQTVTRGAWTCKLY